MPNPFFPDIEDEFRGPGSREDLLSQPPLRGASPGGFPKEDLKDMFQEFGSSLRNPSKIFKSMADNLMSNVNSAPGDTTARSKITEIQNKLAEMSGQFSADVPSPLGQGAGTAARIGAATVGTGLEVAKEAFFGEEPIFMKATMPLVSFAKSAVQAGKKAPMFFSKFAQAIGKSKAPKIGRQELESLAKKSGTVEEASFSNLDKLFKGKKSVTKEEALKHLEKNGLLLEESIAEGANRTPRAGDVTMDRREQLMSLEDAGQITAEGRKELKALHDLDDRGALTLRESDSRSQLKWGPGGQQDLTLDGPRTLDKEIKVRKSGGAFSVEPVPNTKRWMVVDDEGKKVSEFYTKADAERSTAFESNKAGKEYNGPHFDEPNILVHIRTNLRKFQNKTVQFLEEIQSDWHQAGAEPRRNEIKRLAEGYEAGGMETKEALKKANKEVPKDFGYKTDLTDKEQLTLDLLEMKRSKGTELTGEQLSTLESLSAKQGTVPNAPFKDNWEELGIKRSLREAAENDAEYFSWTTGKQQIDRYEDAFRKNIDEISWREGTEHGLPNGEVVRENFNNRQIDVFKTEIFGTKAEIVYDPGIKNNLRMDVEEYPGKWVRRSVENEFSRDMIEAIQSRLGPDSARSPAGISVDAIKGGEAVQSFTFDAKTGKSLQPINGKTQTLDEVVGKSMAEKIRKGGPQGSLSGNDLTIGGEGMMSFYGRTDSMKDARLPNKLKKILRKIDPDAKVEIEMIQIEGPSRRQSNLTPDDFNMSTAQDGSISITEEATGREVGISNSMEDAERAVRGFIKDAEGPVPIELLQPSIKLTPKMRQVIKEEGLSLSALESDTGADIA